MSIFYYTTTLFYIFYYISQTTFFVDQMKDKPYFSVNDTTSRWWELTLDNEFMLMIHLPIKG